MLPTISWITVVCNIILSTSHRQYRHLQETENKIFKQRSSFFRQKVWNDIIWKTVYQYGISCWYSITPSFACFSLLLLFLICYSRVFKTRQNAHEILETDKICLHCLLNWKSLCYHIYVRVGRFVCGCGDYCMNKWMNQWMDEWMGKSYWTVWTDVVQGCIYSRTTQKKRKRDI